MPLLLVVPDPVYQYTTYWSAPSAASHDTFRLLNAGSPSATVILGAVGKVVNPSGADGVVEAYIMMLYTALGVNPVKLTGELGAATPVPVPVAPDVVDDKSYV